MTKRNCVRAFIVMMAASLFAGITSAATHAAPTVDPSRLGEKLVREVKIENINRHLIALQRIADRNGGQRAAHTNGHRESADYIAEKLRAAGFDVNAMEFHYNRRVIDASAITAGSTRVTPFPLLHSSSTPVGGVSGPLVAVPVDATSGCEASDYADLNAAGAIVLIRRGGCTFLQKHHIAADHGAVAAVVYNSFEGPGTGSLVDPGAVRIPAVGVTMAEGARLVGLAGSPATIEVRTHYEPSSSRNLIAQTRTGRANNVVLAGAQLDSEEGIPGINDNGTGSAALLELALRLGHSPRINNAVRFAWWSGEALQEGSNAYVRSLDFERQLDIAMYLNFDLLGARNAGYFVYNGATAPYGSAQIQQALTDYLASRGIPVEGTNFDNNSDHFAFIGAGIPTGGLYTGAFTTKTAAQAAKWGGTAGMAYDPCHQLPCDNLGNVDRTVLDRNADTMAFTVGSYAISTEGVNGVPPRVQRTQLRGALMRQQASTGGAAGR